MMKGKIWMLWSVILLCFQSNVSSAQDRVIDLNLTVLEQLKGTVRSVANTRLNLTGIGEYITDEDGSCAFEAPISEVNRYDPSIDIKVTIRNYEVIRPYNGVIQIDTSHAHYDLEILVIGEDLDAKYKDQIKALNKRLRRSERENSLSLKRMNAMNDSLLLTMQESQAQRAELESTIEELTKLAESEASEKESVKSDLERALSEMDKLRNSLQNKEEELYLALEERYLRQQNYQKAISADLKDFLIHIKDVHDLLQNLDHYFKRGQYPDYTASYNSALTAYNGIFEKINENYLDYLEGIDRYWQSPLIRNQLEDTFDILFDQVHHPKLKPAIMEVNGYIRQNKQGKASKVAHEAFHDLNSLILNLEKSVNRSLGML